MEHPTSIDPSIHRTCVIPSSLHPSTVSSTTHTAVHNQVKHVWTNRFREDNTSIAKTPYRRSLLTSLWFFCFINPIPFTSQPRAPPTHVWAGQPTTLHSHAPHTTNPPNQHACRSLFFCARRSSSSVRESDESSDCVYVVSIVVGVSGMQESRCDPQTRQRAHIISQHTQRPIPR